MFSTTVQVGTSERRPAVPGNCSALSPKEKTLWLLVLGLSKLTCCLLHQLILVHAITIQFSLAVYLLVMSTRYIR